MLEPLNSFTTSAANFEDRPNSGMSATEVKAQFDAAPEELRVFINNLITQLNADFALKSEIASALLGQILDGSLTDMKLSDANGQIKERLSSFIATKGQPYGFTPLDANGVIPDGYMKKGVADGVPTLGLDGQLVQKPYVTGTYTGDRFASRFINLGFTPSAVFLNNALGQVTDSPSGNGGLAVTGGGLADTGSLKILEIVTNGFNVFYNPANYILTNDNRGFRYIAFR